MAARVGRTTCVSLARLNAPTLGRYTALNTATYATNPVALVNRDRDVRGPFVRRPRRTSGEPRTEKMDSQQDWTAVYPTAAPFKPGSVPLPVRMGYPMRGTAPLEKKGNLELVKIPNFLHLTPAAIKKHCEVLKPFCTKWPSGLDTDADLDKHFPIRVESTDYVSVGTSVRNPAARVVHLRVKLSSLNLDAHARDKILRLLGDRYCKDTDIVTITTDSCPLKQQNYDYAMYLLTVLYHEAWKMEAWESEMTRVDRVEYLWEDSASQHNILDTLSRMDASTSASGKADTGAAAPPREELLARPDVQEYRDSVTRLKNEGESESTTLGYKESVKKLFGL